MDVVLPNGVTISGIPDGTTKEQVMQKAIQAGLAKQEDFGVPAAEKGIGQKIDDAILSNPIGRGVAELASSVNRGAVGVADFLSSPVRYAVNAIDQGTLNPMEGFEGAAMNPLGYEMDQTPLSTRGNFMEDGLAKDIIRQGGEMIPAAVGGGAMIRSAASQLPAMASGAESVGAGVLRQMGSSTAAQDAGYAALSGAGQAIGKEVGGDTGAVIGSLAAPITVAGGAIALKGTLNAGKRGLDSLRGITKGVSEDGAATMLAEAMVREGLTPDDVAARMASMGDDGMLADAGNNFARLLRVASNKIPRIEGLASQTLSKRQSGQSARLSGALDDGTGTPLLTVDDEIARLENTAGPEIKKLYEAAKAVPFAPSKRLRTMMEGDNSVGRAAQEAQKNLADYRAGGMEITNMSLIDETKKVLDAQISKAVRDGDKGATSRLLTLKKVMVDEADKAAPEYAKARSMFAGKEQLKNAADLGSDFFKINSRELKQLTETFGESERRMYKLGAKQAIMDRFDNINANADLVGRTFGKNGDIEKLRTLFDEKEQFDQFRDVLEREANWVLTRRTAQANSTTAKQISDEDSAMAAFHTAREALTSPMGAASAMGKIMGGLSKKRGDAAFIKALEDAGDILLEAGMNPESIRSLLKRGEPKLIQKALENQMKRKGSMVVGAGTGLLESQSENTQEANQ